MTCEDAGAGAGREALRGECLDVAAGAPLQPLLGGVLALSVTSSGLNTLL